MEKSCLASILFALLSLLFFSTVVSVAVPEPETFYRHQPRPKHRTTDVPHIAEELTPGPGGESPQPTTTTGTTSTPEQKTFYTHHPRPPNHGSPGSVGDKPEEQKTFYTRHPRPPNHESPASVGNTPVVLLGPEIYTAATAHCSAPCIFVLPPSPLAEPTTIQIPPYTTSLEVRETEGTAVATITTTITVQAHSVITNRISMSNVVISEGQTAGGAIRAKSSVNLPPVPVVLTRKGGQTITRMVTLPPWPLVSDTLPRPSTPAEGATSTEGATIIAKPPNNLSPLHREERILPCPSDKVLRLHWYPATVTLDDCQDHVTMGPQCSPTKTMGMGAAASDTLFLDCTMFTGTWAIPSVPVALPTTWPSVVITPIATSLPSKGGEEDEESDDEDESDDEEEEEEENDNKKGDKGNDRSIPCDAWFFSLCIDWPELKIDGWDLDLPAGVYPPGPPPIKLPDPIKIKGDLPKWPAITVPPNGPIPTPEKPSNCKTESAELCRTVTSYDALVASGITRTTATHTEEDCATIFGCEVQDSATETQTMAACTVAPAVRRRQGEDGGEQGSPSSGSPDCTVGNAIIYPVDPKNVEAIRTFLRTNKDLAQKPWIESTVEMKSDRAGFTALFHVKDMTLDAIDQLMGPRKYEFGVDDAFIIKVMIKERGVEIARLKAGGPSAPIDIWQGAIRPWLGSASDNTRRSEGAVSRPSPSTGARVPVQSRALNGTAQLEKRATTVTQTTEYWELSQLSMPPNDPWAKVRTMSGDTEHFAHYYHQSAGEEQFVYLMEHTINPDHNEFQGASLSVMPFDLPLDIDEDYVELIFKMSIGHGVGTGSKINGVQLGSAKRANLAVPERFDWSPSPPPSHGMNTKMLDTWKDAHSPLESFLEPLLRVMEDVLDPSDSKQGRAIVSMSSGFFLDTMEATPAFGRMLYKILSRLGDMGVLVVAAVHNDWEKKRRRDAIDCYPAAFADPAREDYLPNVLAVGAVDRSNRIYLYTPLQDWVTYAPGSGVSVAFMKPPPPPPPQSESDSESEFSSGSASGSGSEFESEPETESESESESGSESEGGDVPGGVIAVSDGSSFAAPMVAGLAAYLRSLPSRWQSKLEDPRLLKALIKLLHRKVQTGEGLRKKLPAKKYKGILETAWNGQVYEQSCLLDSSQAKTGTKSGSSPLDDICPDIDLIFKDGADKKPLMFGGESSDSDSGSDDNSPPGESGQEIAYQPGPPGPLCAGASAPALNGRRQAVTPDACGKLCTGFFCVPEPVGQPPDFRDPEDSSEKTTTTAAPSTSKPAPKTTTTAATTTTPPPELSGPPELGDCFTSTVTRCAGSGNRQACQDVPVCGPRRTCRIHVLQERKENGHLDLHVKSYVGGEEKATAVKATKWGQTVTWSKGESKFATDLSIEVAERRASQGIRRRDRPPPPGAQEGPMMRDWDLFFTAGDLKWTTADRDKEKKPFCNVGGWHDPPFKYITRDLDCYWMCG